MGTSVNWLYQSIKTGQSHLKSRKQSLYSSENHLFILFIAVFYLRKEKLNIVNFMSKKKQIS